MIRLLLVEDDPVDVGIISEQLKQFERVHIETVDCEEALLELLKSRRPDEFDGVIMDVLLRYTTPERAANSGFSQDIESIVDDTEAGFRCCRLFAEKGWWQPVLLCSNLGRGDLGSLIFELPAFVEFCEKTGLSRRLGAFIAKVRQSSQRAPGANSAPPPN
jgi:CheY-like chemotaxis protein